MGARGPVPKRDAERTGHRAQSERAVPVHVTDEVRVPDAGELGDLGAAGAALWDASCRNPLTRWYEETDWVNLLLLCRIFDRINDGNASSAEYKFAEAQRAALMLTEVDRRRAGLEITREPKAEVVPDVDEQVKRLQGR